MRISSPTIACLFLLLGGHQAVLAQDFSGAKPLPPRAIPSAALPEPDDSVLGSDAAAFAPGPDTPGAHAALPLVPFTSARDALKAWMPFTAGNKVGAVRASVRGFAGPSHGAVQARPDVCRWRGRPDQ